ncbi:hypothetical protein ABK040_003226 [Willaertia magna]
MSSYNVLGLGQPLLDKMFFVSDAHLEALGIKEKGGSQLIENQSDLEKFLKTLSELLNYDCNHCSDHNQGSFHQNANSKGYVCSGGSCANTIKCIAGLEETCGLIGKIGADKLGNLYKSHLTKRGVFPLTSISPLSRTGEVICLITPDGQRTMRAFLGASLEMTEDDLLASDFKGIKLLHVEGYSIYNQPLTLKAMKLAKQHGALVSFDLGSFELVKAFKSLILEYLDNYVDIVFCNSEEARELMGGNDDPEKAADYLSTFCKVAIVMMGKGGCVVKEGSEKYRHYLSPEDIVENPIDTTGAGDMFAGGFLYGYLQGYSLEQSCRLGSLCASSVVKVLGAEIPQDNFKLIKKKVNLDIHSKLQTAAATTSKASSAYSIPKSYYNSSSISTLDSDSDLFISCSPSSSITIENYD